MIFYLVQTNPRQKSEWGGTAYSNILIVSNLNISPENLRILVHEELEVPYFKLYKFLWYDADAEKDMHDNIVVTQLNFDALKIEKFKRYIKDELKPTMFRELSMSKNYKNTFPEGAEFTIKNLDWCMKLLDKEHARAKNNAMLEKIERNKEEFKKFISEIDKATLLELLQETLNEDK